MSQKRVHSVNDLFFAGVALFLLPVNFLLTVYAHSAVSGVEVSVQTLAPQIRSYFQFPSAFISTIITILLPLIILALLIYRKKYWEILQTYISVACAQFLAYLCVLTITSMHFSQAKVGYEVFIASDFQYFPTYIAVSTVILIVVGPRRKERLVEICWLVLGILSLISIIISSTSIMSVLLCFQIGYLVGFLSRFIVGKESERLDEYRLLKEMDNLGCHVDILREIKRTDTKRKRIYYGYLHSDEERAKLRYRVVIFDHELKALTALGKLTQALKLKSFNFKFTSFQTEFEHIALMNHSIFAAGCNFPELIVAKIIDGNMFFVLKEEDENKYVTRDTISDSLQANFWIELEKAHKKGIVYQQIDITQLRLFKGANKEHEESGATAAIWSPENGEISDNKLLQQLDSAQLLTALALLSTPEKALSFYYKHLYNLGLSDKEKRLALTQMMALLDKIVMPTVTKTLLKQYASARQSNLNPNGSNNNQMDLLEHLRAGIQDALENSKSNKGSDNEANIIEYKRFSLGKTLSLGLTVFAVMILLTQLNFDAVVLAFSKSNYFFALLSFALGFITFLGGTIALIGFGHSFKAKQGAKMRFRDIFLVQIAAGWSSIQIPGGLGPLTMNIRYLNRLGSNPAKNSALAGVVQAAQALSSFTMVFIFGILSGQNLPKGTNEGTLVLVAIIALGCLLLAFLVLPAGRRFLQLKILPQVLQFFESLVSVMRSPRGLLIGFSGCIVQELGYALSLWAALLAFGQDVSFVTIVLIFLIANAAGATSPTPGGLGAIEAALTLGLTTIGAINGAVALSVIILYRVCIFWVRAPLGILVEKVLEKRGVV